MARYRMTNKEFEEALREYSLLGKVSSGMETDRKKLRGRIDSEFKHRGVKQYDGETVGAKITDIPAFDYLKGILEEGEYTLQQLLEMGALGLNSGKFREATGKKEKDMEAYKTETGTSPRLNVTPKPPVKREFIKELRKKIRYPTSE